MTDNMKNRYDDVAVLVPCYNEEVTVGAVVSDFKKHLPGAHIYVFDNNSTDRTAQIAKEQGAHVVFSLRQGKGNVVRHMFRVIDAKYYLMVDGDGTYPASEAPKLVNLVSTSGIDMVVGVRMTDHHDTAFRRFHKFGNHLVTRLIAKLFQLQVTDVLSGYRAFSRDFVKSVPLVSEGFEVETELTLQAAAKGFTLKEIPIAYGERPQGSFSKLNTYTDGYLILKAISIIFKDYKPLIFFAWVAVCFGVLALLVGAAPVMDYLRERYVYHVPLAILAAALGVLSMLSLSVGLILDSTLKYHRENFELWRRQLRH